MRRIVTATTCLVLSLSVLTISPSSNAQLRQTVGDQSQGLSQMPSPIAIPASFPAAPAPGAQNANPNATIYSISCPTTGNCVAGGFFSNAAGDFPSFTQTLTNGIWENAIPAVFAPGIQNANPSDSVYSVSCPTAGSCVATGYFANTAGYEEAFTQTLTNGIWANAIPAVFAPGIQNSRPAAYLFSVSCPTAGNCVAGGYFRNAAGDYEAFTQTLTNGTWETAIPASFAAGAQNVNSDAIFNSVSCPSVGNCVAAGRFKNAAGDYEAFTQTLTNGIWANAIPARFPLTGAPGAQNANPDAQYVSVSCPAVGNCVAVGQFKNAAGDYEAFTQTLINGIWVNAIPARFATGVQNPNPNAFLISVSCPSVGNCVAVGRFENAAGYEEAFTQTLTNGIWANAIPANFPTAAQNAIPYASLNSVSCPSVGNCVAAGRFRNATDGDESFTQTLTNGIWATGIPASFAAGIQSTVPRSSFYSVSCPTSGNCFAAGEFINPDRDSEAFTQEVVVSFTTPTPTPTPTPTSAANAIETPTPNPTATKPSPGIGFSIGSATISTAQKNLIKKLVKAAGKSAKFEITGTAGQLPSVSPAAVKKLANFRAKAMKSYLVSLGVSKSDITIKVKVFPLGKKPDSKILAKYLIS